MAKLRESGRVNVRETLIKNKEIATANSEIESYLTSKIGVQNTSTTPNLEDNGSNISSKQEQVSSDNELTK